jgi:P-type Cu+ transporter
MVSIPIEGMTCAACSSRVQRSLQKVEGVEQADVNLASERATVRLSNEASINAVVDAVRSSGYEAPTVTTTLNVGGMTCAACVGRVERAIRKVEGVISADVNLATERATVEHLPTADRREIADAVTGAGYEVLEAGSDEGYGEDAAEESREKERIKSRNRVLSPPLSRCPSSCWTWARWSSRVCTTG